VSTVPEPRLSQDEAAAFKRGVDEFNRGYFFECHDTLEDMWTGVRGPSRDFFQGLIQVSVAFYHLSNGNPAGAQSMLRRALKRFERYPESYFGFDLGAHREELARWLDRITVGELVSVEVAAAPKWRFVFESGGAASHPPNPPPSRRE
jgi:uncharacterized protein